MPRHAIVAQRKGAEGRVATAYCLFVVHREGYYCTRRTRTHTTLTHPAGYAADSRDAAADALVRGCGNASASHERITVAMWSFFSVSKITPSYPKK